MGDDDDTNSNFFDKITGRDELREELRSLEGRVAELETEKETLEERLAAAKERRKDEVREKQSIAEERNRLEDKIAELEGRVSTNTDGTKDVIDMRVSHDDVDTLLERLASIEAQPEGACTARIDDVGALPDDAQSLLSGDAIETIRRRTPCIVLVDDFGLCRVVLEPPMAFEAGDIVWDDSFTVDRSLFVPSGSFTFGVLRSGSFVMAEYDEDERGEVTRVSSDVKSDHSKGGFSQGRFERRRDEQIANHVDKVEDALQDAVEPRIVVGAEAVISDLDVPVRSGTTSVTDASAEGLDRAFREYWKTRLTLL